eukprot:870954-Pyramimonas_sp.AAC.1
MGADSILGQLERWSSANTERALMMHASLLAEPVHVSLMDAESASVNYKFVEFLRRRYPVAPRSWAS